MARTVPGSIGVRVWLRFRLRERILRSVGLVAVRLGGLLVRVRLRILLGVSLVILLRRLLVLLRRVLLRGLLWSLLN